MPDASVGKKGRVHRECTQAATVLDPQVMGRWYFSEIGYRDDAVLKDGLLQFEVTSEEEAAVVGNIEQFMCVASDRVRQGN